MTTDHKKELKNEEKRRYTPWHVYLADALYYIIKPEDMDVISFDKLGTLPLESDLFFIRKKNKKDLRKNYPELKFMIPYLGKYTLVEYKSPLDRLTYEDFYKVRAYRLMAVNKYDIKYDSEINIINLASAFEKGYAEFIERNGFSYKKISNGIYGHINDKGYNIYWIDLKIIGQEDPESFINLFCGNYKKYYKYICNTGITDKPQIIGHIINSIFLKKELMMNNPGLKHLDEFNKSTNIVKAIILETLTLEERLSGLKPEERLLGLKPEEVLSGLKSEEKKRLRELLNQ